MKMIVIAIGFLVGSSAYGYSTSCSDAGGHIKYTSVGNERPYPRKGDLLQSIQVTNGDELISRSTVRHDTPNELGPINPKLDLKSIKMLRVDKSNCMQTEDFSAKLILTKNADGGETSFSLLPFTTYVICQKSFAICK